MSGFERDLMEREDGRKLPPGAQHERRKQALRLHKAGKSWDEISLSLGMGHVTARAAVKTATAEGLLALKPKLRGRRLGDKHQLPLQWAVSVRSYP